MSAGTQRRDVDTLLLDLGNTRAKWALLRGRLGTAGSFERGGAFALRGSGEAARQRLSSGLRGLLQAVEAGTRVRVCCVAGDTAVRAVREAVRERGLPRARFARSEARAVGVRNGYREPWRLGVDRWLGLIGARYEQPGRALCIASIGTALTIDLMDAAGRHLGGTLIPGPSLMIEALLGHTAGVAGRAGPFGRQAGGASARAAAAVLFAHSTREGLRGGALHACAALIERACAQGRLLLGRRPRLVLTGGGAVAVGALLRVPFIIREDLVLRGLAVRSQLDLRPGAQR